MILRREIATKKCCINYCTNSISIYEMSQTGRPGLTGILLLYSPKQRECTHRIWNSILRKLSPVSLVQKGNELCLPLKSKRVFDRGFFLVP